LTIILPGAMRSLLWALYQIAMAAVLLVAGPVLLLRRGRHYRATVPGRLGRLPGAETDGEPAAPGPLWLHAVSVGEVGVAATLSRALPADLPLLLTTVTPTGQGRARAVFGPGSPRVATVSYLPFELAFAVRRFFDRFHPGALVLVEGDYWPLVLSAARRRGLPVVVVNGRISDRSFPRLRLFRPLVGPLMLERVDHFGVQTVGDRDRLLALGVGAERITVTGNLKYETPEPPLKPELATLLRALAGSRPVLVAGSTMEGEEEAVAEAFAIAGGAEKALLVVAPRHPERFGEAAALFVRRGLAVQRRSELGSEVGGGEHGRPAVLLLDTLGELAAVYRLARGAFIGGTLVPTGGHNPLEAARFGVPVAVGPSMENFRQMAEEFDAAGAWRRVGDAGELGAVWGEWLEVPEVARQLGRRATGLIEANRGAVAKTLGVLAPLLASLQAPLRAPGRARIGGVEEAGG